MPFSISDNRISGLPAEARRLWVRVANDALASGRDDVYAIKVAWDVIKKAGYTKRGDKWIKEAINMLKTNLKGKLKKLEELEYSYKHKYLIQEAKELLRGAVSEVEVKLMMSKIDKATNHCLEIAKRKDVTTATKKRAVAKYGDVNYADEKNKKYPLDTPEHVRAAASYFGMPKNRAKYSAADQAKIDAKIKAAKKKFKIGEFAEALNVDDILTGDYISFKEAKLNDEKQEAVITIIRAGFNSNKSRYYTKEALAEAVANKLLVGKKMYKNHLTEADEKKLKGMPRSIDDWVGTIKETWLSEDRQSILGRVKIVNSKFWEFLKQVKEDIGTSINARGKIIRGLIEGIKTNIVKAFTFAHSVDWVTEAGAGGRVLLLENKEEDSMKWDEVTIEDLIEHVPHLVDEIKEQIKIKMKEANMDEKELQELKEAKEKLEKEKQDLEKKIKESEEEANKVKCQEKVLECLKDVKDIPEVSINRIKESLKDLNVKLDEVEKVVKEAIKKERDYLLSLKEAGSNIKGLGETKDTKKDDKSDPVKEARMKIYRSAGYTDKEIEELEKIKY